MVDLLGNLFVIERTFSTVDFVDFWTVVIVFHIGQLMFGTLFDSVSYTHLTLPTIYSV